MRKVAKSKLKYVGRNCPRCGKPLVLRINRANNSKFVGCSNYPKCEFIESKSVVDYVCEDLDLEWRPNIDNKALGLLHRLFWGNRSSRKEVHFLLGVAYFLDHLAGNQHNDQNGICIVKDIVVHNNNKYAGLVFLEPYAYWDGTAPSAMAFVPQLGFANKLHHDFGVFFAPEHSFTHNDWNLLLAVEIDFHPHHTFNPGSDMYRDSLVSYKVLRLLPKKDDPLTWFSQVMAHWENRMLEEINKKQNGT